MRSTKEHNKIYLDACLCPVYARVTFPTLIGDKQAFAEDEAVSEKR